MGFVWPAQWVAHEIVSNYSKNISAKVSKQELCYKVKGGLCTISPQAAGYGKVWLSLGKQQILQPLTY